MYLLLTARLPNIPRLRPRLGPFKSIQDFHMWLREGLKPEERLDRTCEQEWEEIKEMVAQKDGSWPSPIFTHGDLNLEKWRGDF
jgi:hypothetical protein